MVRPGLELLVLAACASGLRPPADLILQARCHLLCDRSNNQCIKECMSKGWDSKPGSCPSKTQAHRLACITECDSDRQCYGVDKCCKHSCGVTCKPPAGLQHLPGLPETPRDLRIHERKKRGVVVVDWSESRGSKAVYVVEERHVPGAAWRPEALGAWAPAHRAPKHAPRAKLALRPGSWYQLRVAAVGLNGTRGFSPPSKHFKLTTSPRAPSAPVELMFSHLARKNGSVSVLLSWDPPDSSDLPLLKYNVAWSRRLPGPERTNFTTTRILTSDKTSLKIKNLEPESTYEFQVEAVTQYGKERLVSPKATLQLNTTSFSYSSKRSPNSRRDRSRQKQMHLEASKASVVDGRLTMSVSWKSSRPPKPYEKFALSWESTDCGPKTSKNVITKDTHYELSGLKFACKYTLFVRDKQQFGRRPRRIGRISFTTPPCTAFNPQPC